MGWRAASAAVAVVLTGGCMVEPPMPGSARYAAEAVSRGYECGVRADRVRIERNLDPAERSAFRGASASAAVKSYKAPHACSGAERSEALTRIAVLEGRRAAGR